jgi:excisionase family DNA binding protein
MTAISNDVRDVLKSQPQETGSPSTNSNKHFVTSGAKHRVPVMSLTQAAEYLQISKAHLSNLINGKVSGVRPLRCARLGRRVLIKQQWIDEWLETENFGALRSC